MTLLSPTGAPVLVMCVALALVVVVTTYRFRRRRRAARDPLTRVFRADELRMLDAHLDQVAVDERGRLAREVVLYIAGDVGHVVVVSDHPSHGIAMWLSDDRLLTVGGTGVTRSLLKHRAANDKLRPMRVDCDGHSYRLVLRGDSGYEMRIHTPVVSLTD